MRQKPLLLSERYLSLATFRRDGSAVETPVWFAPIDRRLYVFTDGTSYKVRRLRRDPRIKVAACTVGGRVTGSWQTGRGRIVSEPDLVGRAYGALHAKYGWQMAAVDLLSRLAGRIKRRLILELELDG
jgi:PPOX class probable F420-dependent enzyme